MAEVPLAALRAVSMSLRETGVDYAFTGGSIVGLLLDYPELNPVRPTDDVDVIVELLTRKGYTTFEERLRNLGFDHDMSIEAPMCRWIYEKLTVDIMPVNGHFLGLNTNLFAEVLETAIPVDAGGVSIRVVSPVGFLVTKYAAFIDRGDDDFFGSHDLEDIITVIDGRSDIVGEVDRSLNVFRQYLRDAMSTFLMQADFENALPGHLPPDAASQARLPGLLSKIRAIAGL